VVVGPRDDEDRVYTGSADRFRSELINELFPTYVTNRTVSQKQSTLRRYPGNTYIGHANDSYRQRLVALFFFRPMAEAGKDGVGADGISRGYFGRLALALFNFGDSLHHWFGEEGGSRAEKEGRVFIS
jgi:hypothetical protein